MTGNVVFLGFAAAGTPGLSLRASSAALLAFFLGAAIGGRIAKRIAPGAALRRASMGFAMEALLVLAAAAVAAGAGADLSPVPVRLYSVIGLTGIAMGLRNAIVRKLAVPDLTTTVLTLTITALAADSPLTGGAGLRWHRRLAAVALLCAGAAMGAWLAARSVALTLAIAGLVTAACAVRVRAAA
jgi:uncharacterized membrane protein YoaK (UPF0700 family)